ncbi:MAG: phosphoribosylformylglycinamidine synthase subunit PurS [Elusimicrobia bacterium]|nr:phosphoribosylformylglycinamidine synthase subunit PurS [Elusimicrobiota bacterium]
MTTSIIEVTLKPQFRDRHGEHVLHDIVDSGVKNVRTVSAAQVYRFDCALGKNDIQSIAEKLLTDPITEEYRINDGLTAPKSGSRSIYIWLKPGVTDTVADSVSKAIRDLGILTPVTIKTGHRFTFTGTISAVALRTLVERLLVNTMVQEYTVSISRT